MPGHGFGVGASGVLPPILPVIPARTLLFTEKGAFVATVSVARDVVAVSCFMVDSLVNRRPMRRCGVQTLCGGRASGAKGLVSQRMRRSAPWEERRVFDVVGEVSTDVVDRVSSPVIEA